MESSGRGGKLVALPLDLLRLLLFPTLLLLLLLLDLLLLLLLRFFPLLELFRPGSALGAGGAAGAATRITTMALASSKGL